MAKIDIARHEVEALIASRAWRWIVATAIERTTTILEENNIIDPFKDPTAICRNQGKVSGIGEFIDLPTILLEQIEFDKKQEEMKENGD